MPMNLKILLPFRIFAEKAGVSRIVAETPGGSFGLLPQRLDCVAALTPGILIYEADSEGEVYVVWDNLNTHYDGPDRRWTEFNDRHGGRFHFVYTPLHASWMNQVEVWFSILQRRLLRYGSFDSPADLAHQVHWFIDHWNRCEAHPFRWTWRTDKVDNPRRRAA